MECEATNRAGKNELPCLCGSCLLFHLYALTEAVGVTDTFQDMRFMGNPVQERSCHDFVAKNRIPIRPDTTLAGTSRKGAGMMGET